MKQKKQLSYYFLICLILTACMPFSGASEALTFDDLLQMPPLSAKENWPLGSSHHYAPYLDTELLLQFKEELLEVISPETFYIWLANAPVSEAKGEVFEWIVNHGFDVNSEIEPPFHVVSTPLEWCLNGLSRIKVADGFRMKHEQMLELLMRHGSQCGAFSQRWMAEGLETYRNHPVKINEKKYKYLFEGVLVSDVPKIPLIMHHIWLTHADAPREIDERDIATMIANKALLDRGEHCWTHVLWVNDPALIPHSVDALETVGITVQPISVYADSLSSYESIDNLIEQKKWGMASDALRYSLLEYFGGVYTDVNYALNRNLDYEIHRYDFWVKNGDAMDMENSFMASKKGHPILKEIVKMVSANIGPEQPEYIRSIQDPNHYTLACTYAPILMAYLKCAHKDGTIDVVYPGDYIKQDRDALMPLQSYAEQYPILRMTCVNALMDEFTWAHYPSFEDIHLPAPYGHDGTLTAGSWKE